MTGNIQNTTTNRICAKCGEEKPLDKDHYQVVKAFNSGFSYYCNDCDKESRKPKNRPNK
jgi:DNA-directed RNA polymerase subunit RPC12/RpoP